MKRQLSALVLGSFLIGCGSTSNSINDAMSNNFTILKGTVPGTLIEVFCDDGSYYGIHSVNNTTDKHPFEVTLPKELNCRLVMSTNEDDVHAKVVTPIRIVSKDGNSTVFKGVGDIADIGHVALALNRNDIVDANGDGVSDVALEVADYSGALAVVHLEVDPYDDDHDGIINIYEDDDHDGISNHDDDDDDNDGIDDIDEVNDDEANEDSASDVQQYQEIESEEPQEVEIEAPETESQESELEEPKEIEEKDESKS